MPIWRARDISAAALMTLNQRTVVLFRRPLALAPRLPFVKLAMPQVLAFNLGILLVLLGAQIMRPPSLELRKVSVPFFLIAFFLTFFTAGYLTYQQYNLWQSTELTRLFLPPHQPIGYFVQYSFTNFWLNSLVAAGAALVGLLATNLLNRKFQQRFFWPEEPWLFATALLLTGHPGWIYYLIFLFATFLLFSIFDFLFSRKREKLTMHWFWLPVAIGVILLIWFKFL